jgi:peptide/nickel transport system substrate-binding protein
MNRTLTLFRGLRPIGILVAGLTLALACGSPPSGNGGNTGNAHNGGKVTLASWQEPDTMLAAGITDSMTHAFADEAPVVEGLWGVTPIEDLPKNPKQSDYWTPQLATEVPTTDNGGIKINGDKMAETIKLRTGVKWHDGQPFGADDVVDTFNFFYLKFKDNNPTPVLSTSGWDQVESVNKVDDHTVTVNWKTTFGPYMSFGGGPYGVLPSHLLQQTWSDPTGKGDMTKTKLNIDLTSSNPQAYKGSDTWDKWLVGTGPFVFKEWVSGDHMTLVKNNNYWGSHKAYLDQITIKFEPDTNTELADLRTGTIDFGVDFRAALLSPLGHVANTKVQILPDSGAEHIDLNLKNKYLSDPVIRKAILQGIDRQKMIDTLLQGKTKISPDSWLCIGTGDWCADPSIPTTKYDPKAATQALDAAGYKTDPSCSGGSGRKYKDGTCIALNLVTTSGNALREQQEVQIASDLQGIGIIVNKPFNNPRSGKLFGSYASGGVLYNHTFDMAMYTNTYSGPAEPDNFYSGYVCDQIPTAANGGVGQNSTQECNPAVDKAFQAGRQKVSQSDRKSSYVDAQKALAQDLPDLPLYQQLTVNAYNTKIGGVKSNDFVWWVNTQDWYLTSGS